MKTEAILINECLDILGIANILQLTVKERNFSLEKNLFLQRMGEGFKNKKAGTSLYFILAIQVEM